MALIFHERVGMRVVRARRRALSDPLNARPGYGDALATLAEAGEVMRRDRQRLSHAVRCIPSLEETVAGASLSVEAIVERPDAKRALYAQLKR